MSSPFSALDLTPLNGALDESGMQRASLAARAPFAQRLRELPKAALVTALLYLPVAFFGLAFALHSEQPVMLWVLLGYLAILALLLIFGVPRFRADDPGVQARFAAANGLRYAPGRSGASLPGSLFRGGTPMRAYDVFTATSPRHIEIGNTVATEETRWVNRDQEFGYLAVRLANRLPHIVLEPRRGGIKPGFVPGLAEEQHLRLEGDWDSWFSLYCPAGYERDALYLFTPDVMARFIDGAEGQYVEIIDDWLFVYTAQPLATLDPDRWRFAAGIAEAVTAKLAQWERWRDPSAPVPQAAPGAPAAAAATPALKKRRIDRDALGCGLMLAVPVAIVLVLAVVFDW